MIFLFVNVVVVMAEIIVILAPCLNSVARNGIYWNYVFSGRVVHQFTLKVFVEHWTSTSTEARIWCKNEIG